MTEALSLANFRRELGRTGLIALFGIAYIISQITIIIILGPIEDAMVKLQTTGVSVGDYLAVFRRWEESGEMAFYRAHFILDDVHWIWYAGLFTTALQLAAFSSVPKATAAQVAAVAPAVQVASAAPSATEVSVWTRR